MLSGHNGATYESSPSELVNGNPLLKFSLSGSGTVYTIPGFDYDPVSTPETTIFTVYKPKSNSAVGAGQAIWGNDDGGWDRFFYSYWDASSLGADGIDDGIVGAVSGGTLIQDSGAIDELYLLAAKFSGPGVTNGSEVYFNGNSVNTFTEFNSSSLIDLSIGWDGDGGYYDGQIAEVLVYDRALDDCEIEQINLYLGDKYGRDFSGFTTTFSGNAPYNNDVNAIGIAPSNCGTTNQINSMSSGEILVDTPSSNDTLNEFLIFAHEGTDPSVPNYVDVPVSYTARQGRAWVVEEENSLEGPADLGTVDVQFDLSALGLTDQGIDGYALLTDDDGVFTDAVVETTVYTYESPNLVTFSGIDFDTGDFFAIAAVDNTVPDATVEQAATQNDPETDLLEVVFTTTFTEPISVASFTCSDITLSGTAPGITCDSIIEAGPMDQTVFDITVMTSGIGTVQASIGASAVTDVLNNDNNASTSSDNVVTVLTQTPGGINGDLAVWFRADAGIVGSPTVTGWDDQSSNSNDASTLGDPQLIPVGINYNPVVDFDGIGDNFTTGSRDLGNSLSYFVVHEQDLSSNRILSHGTDISEDGDGANIFGSALFSYPDGGLVNGPLLRGFTANSGVSANQYEDGAATARTPGSTTDGDIPFFIGSDDSALNQYDGSIAEVIVYDDDIDTGDQVQKLSSYLGLKYGITLDQTNTTDYISSDGVTLAWEGVDINAVPLATIPERELITVNNSSGPGYGIATSAFHLSEDPDSVGTQGQDLEFQVGVAKDLYLVGASSDGPGGAGTEHNGTVNGVHLEVTFDGTSLLYNVVEAIRDHPGPGDWATRTYNSIPTDAVTLISTDFNELFDTNISYNNDIFGIGRDDGSSLDQRISTSSNSGTVLTISLDPDFTSSNTAAGRTTTFGSDLQFLTVANNGGATSTQTSELDTDLYENRVVREWQAQNVGSVGAVNLEFATFDDAYVLLTDADGDFSSGAVEVGALDANGQISGVTLADGTYFTIAESDSTPPSDPTVDFPAANGDTDSTVSGSGATPVSYTHLTLPTIA